MTSDVYKQLLEAIPEGKIILIGEIHGIVENPQFVRGLVDAYVSSGTDVQGVCFEYPDFEQEPIMKAVENEEYDDSVDREWVQNMLQDGRFSRVHFDLLKYLLGKGISIHFMDNAKGQWDQRDAYMAQVVKAAYDKNDASPLLVIAGDLHTMTEKLNIEGKEYTPLGSYFSPDEVFSIRLSYKKGSYYNFGLKDLKALDEEKNIFIEDNVATVFIEEAHPTKK